MDLQGQRVVVIGGSSGMGLATAKAAAEAGAEVVIASRSQGKLDAASDAIPGRAEAHALDFTDEAAVRGFFEALGEFDHLVLVGAGAPAWGEFLEVDCAALRGAFETKFWGHFHCARNAVPRLREGGSIVFVIGGAARSAIPGTSGVAAVNGAIMAMANTLARELAPLRVNTVSPGLVDTPAYDWMGEQEKQAFFGRMGGDLPVGRVGAPEEVAEAVLFLLGNGFATGALLDVDGGGRL